MNMKSNFGLREYHQILHNGNKTLTPTLQILSFTPTTMYQHQLVVSDGSGKTSFCGCGPKFYGRFGKSLVALTVITVKKYNLVRKDDHNILILEDLIVLEQPGVQFGNPVDLLFEPRAPISVASPPPPQEAVATPIGDIKNTQPITIQGLVVKKSEIREYGTKLGIIAPYFHFNVEDNSGKVNVSAYDNFTSFWDDILVGKEYRFENLRVENTSNYIALPHKFKLKIWSDSKIIECKLACTVEPKMLHFTAFGHVKHCGSRSINIIGSVTRKTELMHVGAKYAGGPPTPKVVLTLKNNTNDKENQIAVQLLDDWANDYANKDIVGKIVVFENILANNFHGTTSVRTCASTLIDESESSKEVIAFKTN